MPGSDDVGLGPGREFDLIRRFLGEPARRDDVLVGPGDDCAIIRGGRIAVSSDMSVEGVHFRREWLAPDEIGYRAAAAALSDLAAVAARPIGLLASLSVPEADAGETAVRLMQGVREAADHAGAALLGGDLTRSPGPVVLDVVVLGEVERAVLRGGARPGNSLWVTGALGGAAAAVERWSAGAAPSPEGRAAFARPRPRVREAMWLAGRGVLTAMLDLSDGLAGDAGHLAAASGVAVVLETGSVPVHPAAAALGPEEGLRLALAGGEDYELCFGAAPGAVEAVRAEFEARFGVALTCVGRVEQGGGVFLEGPGGRRPVAAAGYSHF